MLGLYLTGNQRLFNLLNSTAWRYGVGLPSTVASFLGSILMVGRGRGRIWHRRAVLLVLLQAFLLWFWFETNAELFGGNPPDPRQMHELRWVLYRFVGFVGVLTLAQLAFEFDSTVRVPDAESLFRGAQGAIFGGLWIWLIVTLRRFHWMGPWPPRPVPLRIDVLFLMLAAYLARAVAGALTALLCVQACLASSEALREVELQQNQDDPFGTSVKRLS
jgi:hypothetical protein